MTRNSFVCLSYALCYAEFLLIHNFVCQGKQWSRLPDLQPVRAQHGCALVDLAGQRGVIVVGGDSGGTRLSDVRFLPLSAGRQAQKWTKIADLNIARWGRPSVGTIGGRITGTVLCCVVWSALCCSDRGLGRGESSELHRVLQRGCGRVGEEPQDPAVAGAALGGWHSGIKPTHPPQSFSGAGQSRIFFLYEFMW